MINNSSDSTRYSVSHWQLLRDEVTNLLLGLSKDESLRQQTAQRLTMLLDIKGLPHDSRGAELIAIGLIADELVDGGLEEDEQANAWREIELCLSRLYEIEPRD